MRKDLSDTQAFWPDEAEESAEVADNLGFHLSEEVRLVQLEPLQTCCLRFAFAALDNELSEGVQQTLIDFNATWSHIWLQQVLQLNAPISQIHRRCIHATTAIASVFHGNWLQEADEELVAGVMAVVHTLASLWPGVGIHACADQGTQCVAINHAKPLQCHQCLCASEAACCWDEQGSQLWGAAAVWLLPKCTVAQQL